MRYRTRATASIASSVRKMQRSNCGAILARAGVGHGGRFLHESARRQPVGAAARAARRLRRLDAFHARVQSRRGVRAARRSDYSRWIFMVLTIVALVILGRLYRATRPGDIDSHAVARAGLRRRGRQSDRSNPVDERRRGLHRHRIRRLAMADVQHCRHGGEPRRVSARLGAVGRGHARPEPATEPVGVPSPATVIGRSARALVTTRHDMSSIKQERPRVLDRGRRRNRARRPHEDARGRASSCRARAAKRSSGNVVRFTLAFNPGAAFSMSLGENSRYIFGAFAVCRAVHSVAAVSEQPAGRQRCAFSRSASRGAARRAISSTAFTGRSGVVDFIDIGIGDVRFWTFNVADSAVTVGRADAGVGPVARRSTVAGDGGGRGGGAGRARSARTGAGAPAAGRLGV